MFEFRPINSVNDRVIIKLSNNNEDPEHTNDGERTCASPVDSGRMPDSAFAYGELVQLYRSFGQREHV